MREVGFELEDMRKLSWKRQLDAPEGAVIGVPDKAQQRSGLLPARRSNAVWRGKRSAIGCVALWP